MRSDRDKRTDTEREIDDFLAKFEDPADELSADIDSYLNEQNTAAAQTFSWIKIDPDPSGEYPAAEAVSGTDAATVKDEHPVTGPVADQDKEADKESVNNTEKRTDAEEESGNKSKKSRRRKRRKNKRNKAAEPDEAPIAAAPAAAAETVSEADTSADETDAAAEDKASADSADDAAVDDAAAVVTEAEAVDDVDPEVSDAVTEDEASADVTEAASEDEVPSDAADTAAEDEASADAMDVVVEDDAATDTADDAAEDEASSAEDEAEVVIEETKPSEAEDVKAPEENNDTDAVSDDEKPSEPEKPAKKGRISRALFLKKNKNYDPSKGATYEKDGKTIKNKEYKFSFLKLIRDFAVLGLVCVLAGVIVAASIISQAPKYDYKDIYSQIDTASIVYNDEGEQIDNIFYTENRKIVKYKDMPEDLINSFVAIEDKTFWKHHGFNWTRMIGAVLSSLTGSGRISGTSTITQQLARNVYLADTKSVRSIKRKLLEMYYASRLEHFLSKEEIIEAYLNTIYLGHGCYGVNAAARTYFSKSVKKLNLIQCASLAALPQSPDTYALLKLASEAQDAVDSKTVATDPDTIVTNDVSKERRQLTLDLMLSQGLIDKEEYDKVYDLALNDFIKPNLKSASSIYSYFHEYLVDTIIEDLMEQYDMDYEQAERTVYTKGLQIYSTVDSHAMEVIAAEFQDGSNFPYVSAPIDGDGNMLNNDGKVALYSYENYFDDDGNFRLSGKAGDVKVNKDGSITIKSDHKLYIYETDVNGETDYSLEFKSYYIYDDNDILYSISGGYLNIPAAYKSADSKGNVVIDKAFFEDENYKDALIIDGKNVIITPKAYTLSPRQRQPQAAMTIVGVGTGEVKAMVGGRQFGGQKMLNRSLNPRQPGSSIKPLAVYGAALQKSYELAAEGKKWEFTDFKIDRQGTKGWGDYVTMHSSIEDERTRVEGKDWPNNFNFAFTGKNTFKTAIQNSINTCAVKLVLQVGSDYSIEQLKKFGLTTVQDDLSDPVNDANPAALGLGAMTEGVEPLEMALAYASFPGGGKINTPICYTKVLDRNGEVLLKGKSTQSEAMNEGVAWIMQEVLKSVVNYNGYMYVEGVEPGGKTGTTNDQYDIWFDGFTPTYAASIWIGTDENVEMSSMSTPAAALWGRIINQLPKAKSGSYSEAPANVIQIGGDYYTKGTETGLTSWSYEEQEKKARQKAYQQWLRERENHKIKVIDAKAYDEPIYEEKKIKVKDAWTETIEHPAEYGDDLNKPIYGDDPDKPIHEDPNDPTSPIIGYEQKIVGYEQKIVRDAWTEKIKHPAEYKTKKVKTGTRHVDEVWHYEYEPGWRDGDFRYKGQSYNGG